MHPAFHLPAGTGLDDDQARDAAAGPAMEMVTETLHSFSAKVRTVPVASRVFAGAGLVEDQERDAAAGLAMEVYLGTELLAAQEELSVSSLVDVSAPGVASSAAGSAT